MITKYMTGWFAKGELIKKIEVEKETEKSVIIDGRRNAKFSEHAQYHESFDEAKAFLMQKAEARLTKARRSLEDAQGFYGNVKGLKSK